MVRHFLQAKAAANGRDSARQQQPHHATVAQQGFANATVSNKLMVGFEDFVLRVFVAVQSLVLASLSSITSGAMEARGLSRMLGRLAPPVLAAESNIALPPAPVVEAPAAPRISGNGPVLPAEDVNDDALVPARVSESSPAIHPAPMDPAPETPRIPGCRAWSSWGFIPPAISWGSLVLLTAVPLMMRSLYFRRASIVWFLIVILVFHWGASRREAPPPPPPASGRDDCDPAHRSAGSMRGCIVEAVLSAIVLMHAVKGVVTSSTLWQIVELLPVVVCTKCGANEGLSQIHPSYARRSVDLVREMDRLRDDSSASSDLDGVDIFEYNDMVTLSLAPLSYSGQLSLFLLWCVATNLPLAGGVWPRWCTVAVVGAWCVCSSYAVVTLLPRRPRLRKLFLTRPRCRRGRFLLLLSGVVYAVSLFCSPLPSWWMWSLIVTHTTRLLNVLVALRGHNEGWAEAAAEIVEHVSEVV
ncbi:unnamed protein product [Scytosiphon promiscuus]